MQLYVDEGGTVGVEYKTPMGRMDLLTVDKKGGLLIVELKVERGPDEVCGLIIAQHISERIRYALADVPGVTAREYKLHITLADVPHVNEAKP